VTVHPTAEQIQRLASDPDPGPVVMLNLLRAVRPKQSVIGPMEGEWDLVLLVEYPSRAKFLEMATNEEYLIVHAHRESALADSRLIACSSLTPEDLAALH
jgi:hypothetical protein